MTIEFYERYLVAAKTTPWEGLPVPYHWGQLPRSLSIGWLAYGLMFEEFSAEIANSLNQLNDYAYRLKVWSTLVPSMDDQEKLDVAHEFIEPIATIALTLPYVIRSRFIFAIAHLCHQANQSREGAAWKDDLPLMMSFSLYTPTNTDLRGDLIGAASYASKNSAIKNFRSRHTISATRTTTVFHHEW